MPGLRRPWTRRRSPEDRSSSLATAGWMACRSAGQARKAAGHRPARGGWRPRRGRRAARATPGMAAGRCGRLRSRPCSRARLRLTRRKRRSVPKNANPIGASRSSVASSAESDTSMPDTRGCGTDVSVLIAADTRPVSEPAIQRLLPAHCGHKQASGNNAPRERQRPSAASTAPTVWHRCQPMRSSRGPCGYVLNARASIAPPAQADLTGASQRLRPGRGRPARLGCGNRTHVT